MKTDSTDNAPFRDVIRERNAARRATEALAEFEDKRSAHNLSDHDYAMWTGTLAATVEDLLAVIANLQAVADRAEGDAK